VILTRSGRLPRNANIFCDSHAKRTLIYRNQRLKTVLHDLGRREITSVLIEGGGEVLSQALDQGLIDKVQIYIGSKLTGGNVLAFGGKGAQSTAESFRLRSAHYTRFGDDLRVTGYPKSPAGIR
jgi:diaminohydroxyphosphoribosylaminopyrimidine deaminase/5-amino-6-(5-phosphoribosylamino)uracil reductase